MTNFQHELAIAKQLAHDAGDIMRKYFNSAAANPTLKSDKTFVTKADKEINSHVIAVLQQQTPGYSIWGEEESSIIKGAKYTWVCDPIDGTMPFVKAIPISSFSLALVDENGDSIVGVICDPYQDRLFEAVKGGGAYLNGERITVSEKADFDAAYIDEELWFNHEEGISFDDQKDAFNKAGAKVTTFCSAVMAGTLVARGAYEAMLFGQNKPEDIAALAVIVPEAGGKVTNLFGKPQRYDADILGAVVSNGKMHDAICDVLKNLNYKSNYLT